MPMRRVALDAPDPAVIAEAAAHLRAGRLVAFPTETVYGLGANAMDPAAVARIYAAKGRPAYNPLIVHVASASRVDSVAAGWPDLAARLAEAFWPGPLTLVVPKRPEVPDEVTAGLPSVAVRVPAHPVALALLEAAGIPIAAPSANRSMELSPTRAEHVERALGDRVAMILDGGPTAVGIESTVVDVTGAHAVLLRPGGLSRASLEQVAGPVYLPSSAPAGTEARASPGMLDRHYAPRARLVLFSAAEAGSVAAGMARSRALGEVTGGLVWSDAAPDVRSASESVIVLPADPEGYARGLYSALHEFDARGCTLVAAERPPDGDAWDGVRDRLERAARS